ncbi:M61 family metallopeptidase [Sphingomonas nostoxanthinifaciens]|uniref:M61 family metallopeptidase n=1 Tax=Sphingomonas nostoxanthinifaciens TaxID=2872652 RepID=UPI001CC1D20F|nr:peptidase M61 [Sphingomonas nostoxanthinifaciens]UAK25540.1 peptidase M61 [Sphingomonas nostoxanthinifaciens]
MFGLWAVRCRLKTAVALTVSVFLAVSLAAQAASPLTVARTALPAWSEKPFRGTIELDVDASDTVHGIVKTHETIPVQRTGDVTLLYPEWETASHAPTVPVASLAGLTIRIDGRRVEWRRDPLDVHVFHISVPAGAEQLAVDLQYIADRGTLREGMLSVPWQRVLLYPAGWSVATIRVAASLRVPTGLTTVTSLDQTHSDGSLMRFAPTSLERLVDAPFYAARHARTIDLMPGDPQPVRLDILAEDPALLAASNAEIAKLRALMTQTRRLMGPAPFRHYDAIVALDDGPGAGGIEHLEEGENILPTHYFLDPAKQLANRDLIAHELVHAWNGRFRQPADLWTPTFNQPVGGSLLWVYEGQTEFWGRVLAARSGLRTRQETLDKLALDAALVANRPGRAWKSLADSTNDAIYMAGHHVGWRDWQRREDYYPEGVLLWLDVDARLRELSGGRRGLDDFAALFFHAVKPDGTVSTYTFEDVCRTLDMVAHDDWSAFLMRHLQSHDDADAMAGLTRAGWRLIYTSAPTESFRQDEAENGGIDLTYSIGAVVGDDGRVESVAWDGPAFRAGLTPGMRLLAIGASPFSIDALRQAVSKTPSSPLILTAGTDHTGRKITVVYDGGLRYPKLERLEGVTDRLSTLLAP